MFDELLSQLSNKAAPKLHIKGIEKIIKGAARFSSVNMPNEPYIKISFDDSSGLILLVNSQQMFYAPFHLKRLEAVEDADIGTLEEITYEGKMFKLVNKNDYQFVKELLIGSPGDIEGECRFSDYMTEDEACMLSIGFNSYTGERDDAYAEILLAEEIIVG